MGTYTAKEPSGTLFCVEEKETAKGKKIYERHAMKQLPVIFHHDTVDGGFSTSNWHDNIEILLFTEGEGRVYLEGTPMTFSVGDICVIDSGVLHRIESCTDGRCGYFCLIVDGDFCRRQGIMTEGVSFAKQIRDRELAELYNKIAEAVALGDEYCAPAVKGAVLCFMVHLLRHYGERGNPRSPHSDAGLRRVIHYIRAHYAESFDIDTLASMAGISKFHFLREFKRLTGQTVITYVNTVRIEYAARMLAEGNTTVSAVAAACGFASHAYFSKIFYRLRGVHPSALLRKKNNP